MTTDPAALLAGALPADPTDHGPIAIPSDTVRQVLGVLVQSRRIDALPDGTLTVDLTQDRGE